MLILYILAMMLALAFMLSGRLRFTLTYILMKMMFLNRRRNNNRRRQNNAGYTRQSGWPKW